MTIIRERTPIIEKVTIIGLGLIGGSIGLALGASNFAREIVGVDVCQGTLEQGVANGAITGGTTSLAQGVAGAQLVVLAVPVRQITAIAKAIKPHLEPGCIVTDVGSTKGELVITLETIFHPLCHFVGGHPMAGSEKHGIAAADQFLLENAYYIITTTENTVPQAQELVEQLVQAVGARVIHIPLEQHDRIVAAISHVPHLVAVSLVNGVSRDSFDIDPLALAAGGFKDSTRIAASDPLLWRDICFSNKEQILASLAQFKRALTAMEDSLVSDDEETFIQLFQQARASRESIPTKVKGLLPGIYQVLVTVADRPGVFGRLAQILGDENINIIHMEIMRVREDGGTLELGFASSEQAEQACKVLAAQGITARIL